MMESPPVISGDGRWIYFSTARRQSYPKEFDRVCHSICRVGFDAENARFDTGVDTLVHAGQAPIVQRVSQSGAPTADGSSSPVVATMVFTTVSTSPTSMKRAK